MSRKTSPEVSGDSAGPTSSPVLHVMPPEQLASAPWISCFTTIATPGPLLPLIQGTCQRLDSTALDIAGEVAGPWLPRPSAEALGCTGQLRLAAACKALVEAMNIEATALGVSGLFESLNL